MAGALALASTDSVWLALGAWCSIELIVLQWAQRGAHAQSQ
jgi:hypothetical protein